MQNNLSANNRIAGQLETIISSERKIHAFAFCGGSKKTREEIGMWFSSRLLCHDEISKEKFEHGNSEDLIIVEKTEDRETIVKDQILELVEKLQFKPYDKNFVVLIKDADKMNESAQNKLLKALEEPTSEAVFILLAEKEELLLSTIKSRCSIFHLEEADDNLSTQSLETARKFAGLVYSKASYYKKKNLILYILNDKDNQKALALEFITALESVFEKDMIAGKIGSLAAIPVIEETRGFLEQSFSIAYTLKQFCLKL